MEIKKIFLILFIFFAPVILWGQDKIHPPSPDNVSMQNGPPPVGLPIDFGISALIAAGLGLGIYHIKNKK